jgi:hypothetical protein
MLCSPVRQQLQLLQQRWQARPEGLACQGKVGCRHCLQVYLLLLLLLLLLLMLLLLLLLGCGVCCHPGSCALCWQGLGRPHDLSRRSIPVARV